MIHSLKNFFWKTAYPSYQLNSALDQPGYSILVPFPGDLFCYLESALLCLHTQQLDGLVETLLIPDFSSAACSEKIAKARKEYPNLNIVEVKLHLLDRAIVQCTRNPGHIYWLQLLRGIEATKSTHFFLHDADCFLLKPNFFESQWKLLQEKGFQVLGVSPAWDKWFKEQNYDYLVATWEMLAEKKWWTSFPPWLHHGHVYPIRGVPHVCDVTFIAQTMTDSDKIGLHSQEEAFLHFNYVISTYRWFEKSKNSFEDDHFRLLLTRLLHDCLCPEQVCKIPPLSVLKEGWRDAHAPVTYRDEKTKQYFPEFKTKMAQLTDSMLYPKNFREHLSELLEEFHTNL